MYLRKIFPGNWILIVLSTLPYITLFQPLKLANFFRKFFFKSVKNILLGVIFLLTHNVFWRNSCKMTSDSIKWKHTSPIHQNSHFRTVMIEIFHHLEAKYNKLCDSHNIDINIVLVATTLLLGLKICIKSSGKSYFSINPILLYFSIWIQINSVI